LAKAEVQAERMNGRHLTAEIRIPVQEPRNHGDFLPESQVHRREIANFLY